MPTMQWSHIREAGKGPSIPKQILIHNFLGGLTHNKWKICAERFCCPTVFSLVKFSTGSLFQCSLEKQKSVCGLVSTKQKLAFTLKLALDKTLGMG